MPRIDDSIITVRWHNACQPETDFCPRGARQGCAYVLCREVNRQREARAILDQLQPLTRWRQFGDPVLCGAMAYGLLVAPDIDIEIFGEPRVRTGFSLVAEWATSPAVTRVLYLNALDDADGGLGWELRYRYHGRAWNVQMWLLPDDYAGPRSADLVPAMRRALNDASRSTILRIKESLLARAVAYRSIDVYRAVLDDGVATAAAYESWCRSHASTGLLAWAPAPRPELGGEDGLT